VPELQLDLPDDDLASEHLTITLGAAALVKGAGGVQTGTVRKNSRSPGQVPHSIRRRVDHTKRRRRHPGTQNSGHAGTPQPQTARTCSASAHRTARTSNIGGPIPAAAINADSQTIHAPRAASRDLKPRGFNQAATTPDIKKEGLQAHPFMPVEALAKMQETRHGRSGRSWENRQRPSQFGE